MMRKAIQGGNQDDTMKELFHEIGDHGSALDGLEDRVWARVSERGAVRRERSVLSMTAALALAIGAANGGLIVASQPPAPSELQVLTVDTALSPFAVVALR